jgi:hypothetical protein
MRLRRGGMRAAAPRRDEGGFAARVEIGGEG